MSGLARAVDLEGGVVIRADALEYEHAGDLYVARGGVEISQDGDRLQADWVAFSPRSGRGVANGHVRVEQGSQRVEAEGMEFELDGLRGALREASIDTGPGGFRIRAREVERTGESSWVVREGHFTTCRCPEPDERTPWEIDAAETDVELGGYGRARNAHFDVLGLPVVWLPRMLYPVKTERETGLLLPELAFGGLNGVQAGLPVFWAARPDLNVLWTPRYLQKRGFKSDLELEYVQGERSGGTLYGSYTHDDKDDAPRDNRWAARVDHDQQLPREWRLRTDVKLVSDNLYLNDFDDLGIYRRDLFLRSQLFGFRHFGTTGRLGLVGAVHYADDVSSPSDTDRDGLLLQRWPDLDVRVLAGDLGPASALGLSGSLDAGYAYFGSVDAAPTAASFYVDSGVDGIAGTGEASEADGLFQEGEPLRDRGQRLVLAPRLARPLRIVPGVELRPELGYTQILYDSRRDGFDEQGLLSARVDLESTLRGRFGGVHGPATTHLLRPFASWVLLRSRSQAGSPVFVPPSVTPQERLRQLEAGNLSRDPSDRVADANRIVVGLGNRFYGSGRGTSSQGLGTDVSLSFAHDFDTGRTGRWVVDGRSYARFDLQAAYALAVDASAARVEEGLMDVSAGVPAWGPIRSGRLGTRYRFLRDAPRLADASQDRIQQIDVYGGLWLGRRIQLRYALAWSLEDDAFLTHGGGIGYVSGCRCWALGVDVYEDRTRGVQYNLRYTLIGLGDDGQDPFARRRGISAGGGQ